MNRPSGRPPRGKRWWRRSGRPPGSSPTAASWPSGPDRRAPSTGLRRCWPGARTTLSVMRRAPGDPPFWKRTWQKANPSLRYLPDLEAAIRAEAIQAKRDPSLLAAFEALRLNLGTDDTEVAVLLDAKLWTEIEGEAEMVRAVYMGNRPGHVGRAVRGCRLLAGDGRARVPGGVPVPAVTRRARAARWRLGALPRVREARGIADAGPASNGRSRVARGGA